MQISYLTMDLFCNKRLAEHRNAGFYGILYSIWIVKEVAKAVGP